MKKSNEQSLGDAIRTFIKQHQLDGKLAEAEVVAAWTKVLGPAIDRRTKRIRMQKGGVVYVELNSSSLRNELNMQRSKLKDALNQSIGREIVNEIHLV